MIGSGRAAAEMALVSLRSSQVKQLARRAGPCGPWRSTTFAEHFWLSSAPEGIDDVRTIRDETKRRVEQLIGELQLIG